MEKLGRLLIVEKIKCSGGKSSITNKQLKRIRYMAYFFKEGDPIKGYISDKQSFTEWHMEKSKANMTKFLKINGYTNFIIENII